MNAWKPASQFQKTTRLATVVAIEKSPSKSDNERVLREGYHLLLRALSKDSTTYNRRVRQSGGE